MNDRAVLTELRRIAVSTLGIPDDDLDDSANLLELGLDSLMLLRFGQEIERRFGVRLEIAWFFKNLPSLQTLSAHVTGMAGEASLQTESESPARDNEVVIAENSIPLHESHDNTHQDNEAVEDELSSLFRMQAEALETLFARQLSALGAGRSETQSLPSGAAGVQRSSETKKASGIKHDFRGIKLTSDDGLTPEQEAFIDATVARHVQKTAKSKAMTQNYRLRLADWKNTLSFRARLKEAIYPIIADGSNGSLFTDIDGNEYIDIALGMGVNFMGHRHPRVVSAVEKRLASGFELGPQCNMTGRAAELVGRLIGMERVCFCNTGSEAVMVGLRLARAKTGRSKVVLFNGSYHGIFDGVLGVVSGSEISPLSPGTPPGMVEDIVMLDYDSAESLAVIENIAGDVAAVLVEPVQSRRPSLQPQTFLRRLRRLTKERGIALIFDEMVNGFRISPGGAQEYFGIRADIALYGKTIGGGLPVGVIAGSSEYLDLIDGGYWEYGDGSLPSGDAVVFGGTFCRHPFTMESVASVAELMLEEGQALQDRVSRLAEKLADDLNLWFRDEHVPLRISRFGSQFKFESYGPWTQLANAIEIDLFYMLLTDAGVYTWERRTCCLSVAHTEDDIRRVIEAVKQAVVSLREGGFPFRLERGATDSLLPVTSVQKRIFAAMQRENGQAPYHMPASWIVRGTLDVEWLEICLGELIKRHECLRSGFRITGGELYRYVVDEPRFFIERIVSGGRTHEEIYQGFMRPFDLEHPPLVRVGVADLGNDSTLLMFDSLHIVVDGIALATVTSELNALYNGQSLPPVKTDYSLYTHYMREFEESDTCRKQIAFWEKTLADAPPPLKFSRKPSAARSISHAGHVRTEIAPVLRERIRTTAASCGVTPYMLMLAAYASVIRSLSGEPDIVVAAATAGRLEDRFETTVGMFVNTLPLRLTPDSSQSFRAFLGNVREVCADAYQHQDVPYELIVEKTGDVVGTMFTFETADERRLDLSGLSIDEMEASIPGSMFDFSLDAIETNNTIHLDFEFDPGIVHEECVREWASCFTAFVERVCADPDVIIASVPLMPEKHAKNLHAAWNDTRHDYTDSETIIHLFEASVKNHPGETAVIDADGEMTYAQLDALSARVADILASEYGVGPEKLTAVCAPPSAGLVAAILGIMRAGGAFLPMEHEGPVSRARHILDDAGIDLLIGEGELFEKLDPERTCELGKLTDSATTVKETVRVSPKSDSLAYIIYTSGSTGKPKGCEIEHGSLHNYVSWAKDYYFPDDSPGNICLTSPSAFDMSLMTLFVPLCSGGILRIPGADVNPAEALAQAVSSETETDTLNLTPSHVRIIRGLGIESTNARIAVVGGEALRGEDIETLLALNPDMSIYNEYGPTEATVGCTSARVASVNTLTVGRPIYNTTAYILDADKRLLPPGAWGELAIGGAGLARGYRNHPELTNERFGTLPLTGERIYRTGDIARRSMDGTIELGGRIDDQLKIAGHRIEPGEVEDALRMCKGVAEAAIVYNGGLCAFVTGDCKIDKVKKEVSGFLPAYMLPHVIVRLDVMPVSSSGKINRKSLIKMSAESKREAAKQDESQPSSPALRIMREISGNPDMGETDNFFSAGGNSLDAVAVVARCGKELGIDVGLRDFFENPTAETIQRFDGHSTKRHTLRHTIDLNDIPQTSGQKQIWLASQTSGSAYNMTEMFTFDGSLDAGLLERSFAELIRRHEILRTTFHERSGVLYQQVMDFSPERLFFDLTDISDHPDTETTAREMADEEMRHVFDLSIGPLMRVRLLCSADNRHLCILNIHHIITDGWSASLMLDEVSRIYRAGGSLPDEAEWQYRDYAVWHDEYLNGHEAKADFDYWRNTLYPPIPVLSLPGRMERTQSGARPAVVTGISMDAALVRSLDKLARENNSTLFMSLLAGLTAILHQRTSDEDIVVGTPAAGRVLPEFESMPGYFLNTLPVRMRIAGRMTFRDMLREAAHAATTAFAHQRYPFDAMADGFSGSRDDGRNPFFDVMLILQNTADYRFDLPGITAKRSYSPRSREAKFEIMIELETGTDGLGGVIEYDTTVYDRESIDSIAADLVNTLEYMAENPDALVSSLFAKLSREDDTERRRFLESITGISEEF